MGLQKVLVLRLSSNFSTTEEDGRLNANGSFGGRGAGEPATPTYEGLVGGLGEAALLVQQRQHPHGLLQEQVQQGTVVLVLNHPGVHVLVQVLILHERSEMLKGLGEALPLLTSRGAIARKGSTAPPRGQTEPQSSILEGQNQ